MSYDRDTKTGSIELIKDPDEKAQREAENAVRQFKLAKQMIAEHIAAPKRRPLTHKMIMQLHFTVMEGIHPLAGTFRNTGATMGVAKHIPPVPSEISDHFAEMVSFVNDRWDDESATYLATYLLWRLNWIHPFGDGNGRTSRMVAYVVLSMKMESILPGSPSIPDQISENHRPEYYAELEKADDAYAQNGRVAISSFEAILEEMLENQLRNAVKEAGGEAS